MEKKSYYKPSEISYNIHQLTTFLLPNLTLLLTGKYPVEPTGYTDAEYTSPDKFIDKKVALDIGAEINKRLEMIGYKSLLLLELYEEYDIANRDIWDSFEHKGIMITVRQAYNNIASRWHIDSERVHKRANSMLRYMIGIRRPEVDYYTWLKNGRVKYPVMELINEIISVTIMGRSTS